MAAGYRAEHDEAFRAGLREFLAGRHPGLPPKDPRERLAWIKAWLATLFDNGGPAGLLEKAAPQAVQRSRWLHGFLRTRASTIGAGTREIQLNTVAEQVLGLPHEPGMPAR
jgi:hypothetical protein